MNTLFTPSTLRTRAPFLGLAAAVTLTLLASLGQIADSHVHAEQLAQVTPLSAPTQLVVVIGKRNLDS